MRKRVAALRSSGKAEVNCCGDEALDPVCCSFHNGLTAHGAGASMTLGWRIAKTCAYMPIGRTYNGVHNILPPELRETLSEGDVLSNDEWNPVVWAGA